MKVFISVPLFGRKMAESHAHFERIASTLREYGHLCVSTMNLGWLEDDDVLGSHALILGQGWEKATECRLHKQWAMAKSMKILYEGDLDVINPQTLSAPGTSIQQEYRTLETDEGIKVQVKGLILGLWHTVKTYRYDSDPDYARLLAEELIDKLTDD